jgi:Transposase DNA-binding/Transposase DDE domain
MNVCHKGLGSELATSHFRDRRLSRRLGLIVEKLSQHPSMGFPKVFSSAELEAAYRFFGNPVVTPDRILSGHFDATRKRCLEERTSLVIHDTTTLSYRSDGQRKGLGRLQTLGQTFFAHAALVIADDDTRRPLGIAGLEMWARGEDKVSGQEQARWRRTVSAVSTQMAEASLIHLMDREGDDYALLSHLTDGGHRFVIRAKHNRILGEKAPNLPQKLNDALATVERVMERAATLSKRVDAKRSLQQKKIHPSRATRVATLAVGATAVVLQRPAPHPRDSDEKRSLSLAPTIALNVVRVWEPAPPADTAPIEWVLLTTEPVETTEELLRVVDRYRARWTIEEFFKALKTGCAYESRQLGDYESLTNALAVFAPIACQLLVLRSEAARAPDAAAETVIPADQVEVLRALGRRKLPSAPTVYDIVLAIAALGGHIAYGNRPPGWLTLARGYAELLTLTRGWNAAKLQRTYDQG